jgi:hypothetical protein
MADDGLFGDPKEGGAQDAEKEGNQSPAVDHEALEKTISKSLEGTMAPVMGEIGKAIGSLNAEVGKLKEGREAPVARGDPATSDLEAFLANPDEVISKKVSEMSGKDAPLRNAIVKDRVETHSRDAEAKFDSEYGKGSYKEHMEKPVMDILKNYPPEYLVGADGVNSALTQIKGQNIELLMDLREKAKVKVEEKGGYTPLKGGRADPDPKKGVDPEAKLVLEKMREAGFEDANEKTYAAMQDIPPTLSAYLKYKESQKNAR